MELAPSVVRNIILEEHAQLRTKLSAMEEIIRQKDYKKLQNAVSEFTYFFLKHIEAEERILRPVLKDIDAWGAVRVDRMNADHARQRDKIQTIEKLIAREKPEKVVSDILDFIADVHEDIEEEERDCLNPEVMKDDPITVHTTCG